MRSPDRTARPDAMAAHAESNPGDLVVELAPLLGAIVEKH
jgi:hypothetical protein